MAAQRRRRRFSQREPAPTPIIIRSSRNPGVSAVLSAVVPGLGQIYNGQLAKGVLLLVLFAVSCLLITVVIGALFAPLIWVLAILDAYKTAQAIDRPPPPPRPAKAEERDEPLEYLSDGSPLPDPTHVVLRDAPLHDLDAPPTFRTVIQTLPAGTRVAVLTEDDDGWVEVALASGQEGLVQAAGLRPLAFTEQAPVAPAPGPGAGRAYGPAHGPRPVEHWRRVVPWAIAAVAFVEALAFVRQALLRGSASWLGFAVLLLLLAAWVTNVGGLQARLPAPRSDNRRGSALGWAALVVLLALGGVMAFAPVQPATTPVASSPQEPTAAPQRAPAPPAPPASAPPAYSLEDISSVSVAGRPRLRANAIVGGFISDDQAAAALADAARRLLRERREVLAVVVFGYRSRAQTNGPYTLGQAWASRDRLGWAGDGLIEGQRDDGQIVLVLGDATTLGNRTRRSVPQ